MAVPTETVYGLAADALSPRACRAIFKAKGRPLTDPLIVHVPHATAAEALAEVTDEARILMRAFWPGPLTLVLKKRPCISDVITAGRNTVAVRCPAHPVMRRLLRLCGRPLAAPSANPFGGLSPTTAAHVQQGLGQRIRLIVDGGACRVGIESTIVDLSHPGRPRILRAGGITAAALATVLGRKIGQAGIRGLSAAHAQKAPGMLTRHYSPHTPLCLHNKITKAVLAAVGPHEGFLFFAPPRFSQPGGCLPRSTSWTRAVSAGSMLNCPPNAGQEQASTTVYGAPPPDRRSPRNAAGDKKNGGSRRNRRWKSELAEPQRLHFSSPSTAVWPVTT